MNSTVILNGDPVIVEGDLTRRLLDFIRNEQGLVGTKEGCQEGECGACLVFIDDDIFNACLLPMGNAIGRRVTTIEAFSKTEAYSRIEKAYLETGAVQCGYCTPGMVMATEAILRKNKAISLEEIQLELSGNLCRCTGYQSIFEAVTMLLERGGMA